MADVLVLRIWQSYNLSSPTVRGTVRLWVPVPDDVFLIDWHQAELCQIYLPLAPITRANQL